MPRGSIPILRLFALVIALTNPVTVLSVGWPHNEEGGRKAVVERFRAEIRMSLNQLAAKAELGDWAAVDRIIQRIRLTFWRFERSRDFRYRPIEGDLPGEAYRELVDEIRNWGSRQIETGLDEETFGKINRAASDPGSYHGEIQHFLHSSNTLIAYERLQRELSGQLQRRILSGAALVSYAIVGTLVFKIFYLEEAVSGFQSLIGVLAGWIPLALHFFGHKVFRIPTYRAARLAPGLRGERLVREQAEFAGEYAQLVREFLPRLREGFSTLGQAEEQDLEEFHRQYAKRPEEKRQEMLSSRVATSFPRMRHLSQSLQKLLRHEFENLMDRPVGRVVLLILAMEEFSRQLEAIGDSRWKKQVVEEAIASLEGPMKKFVRFRDSRPVLKGITAGTVAATIGGGAYVSYLAFLQMTTSVYYGVDGMTLAMSWMPSALVLSASAQAFARRSTGKTLELIRNLKARFSATICQRYLGGSL